MACHWCDGLLSILYAREGSWLRCFLLLHLWRLASNVAAFQCYVWQLLWSCHSSCLLGSLQLVICRKIDRIERSHAEWTIRTSDKRVTLRSCFLSFHSLSELSLIGSVEQSVWLRAYAAISIGISWWIPCIRRIYDLVIWWSFCDIHLQRLTIGQISDFEALATCRQVRPSTSSDTLFEMAWASEMVWGHLCTFSPNNTSMGGICALEIHTLLALWDFLSAIHHKPWFRSRRLPSISRTFQSMCLACTFRLRF